MALEGSFNWFNSLRQGGRKAISFTLRNTNMLQNETFDCAIVDGTGQLSPQIRRQIKLKPKESFRFDYNTCDWEWCQGDFFAILGKNDKITKRWDLNLNMYGRGECPECHGMHKCKYCNGSGMIYHKQIHSYSQCQICYGTGICQTCYVPIRQGSNLANQMVGNVQTPNPNIGRMRKINALREQIKDLQSKIEQEEWELRVMQLRGTELFLRAVYDSHRELKQRYSVQLIHIQSELQQLENMQYNS